MIGYLYKLTCLTNLHVGSGESTFSVVDNEVSRDPVTGIPMIHSSGIKGAFRQYFEDQKIDEHTIESLFGSDVKKSRNNGGESTVPGKINFFDAYLLAQAVRSSGGDRAYYLTVPATALGNLKEYAEICNKEINTEIDKDNTGCNTVGVEDIILKLNPRCDAITMFGLSNYVIISGKKYNNSIFLPVFARNQLDDYGISKNLWYEEVVPHKSVFFFAVLAEESDESLISDVFDKTVNTKIVQFGGNASIGQGFCKVERV